MKYYLDTEFNGLGGDLISLALVSEDDRELYVALDCPNPGDWVAKNVLPIITVPGATPRPTLPSLISYWISIFLQGDRDPCIIADWPDDIRYFCTAVITGPGQMIIVPSLRFEVRRIDAYPTMLPGAVQHNALWDARALRYACEPPETRARGLSDGAGE